MESIEEIFDNYFQGSRQQQGRTFEQFIHQVFTKHPGDWGRDRFENVWLWRDWPDNVDYRGRIDIGVDIVAKQTETYGGGLVAVQAKYGSSTVRKAEVDSFLGASESEKFKLRLIVTTRSLTSNVQAQLENANPECQVITTQDIAGWFDDRESLVGALEQFDVRPSHFVTKRHELHDFQREAIKGIQAELEGKDRTKLILPCGTGKSFVALRTAEKLFGSGKTIAYLVPSLALVRQTIKEWSRHRDRDVPIEYIAVCSDKTVGRDDGTSVIEMPIPVTTRPKKLAERLSKPVPGGAMRVVFCTYQSSDVLALALSLLERDGKKATLDLIIADEAHRTTGIEDNKQKKKKLKHPDKEISSLPHASEIENTSPFLLLHSDTYLPARKRIYMTATPRVFTPTHRKKLEQRNFDGQSYSMDDVETYGDEAYRMSFAHAIKEGYLSDYEIVIIGGTQDDFEREVAGREIDVGGEQIDSETIIKLAGCWDALASPLSKGQHPELPIGGINLDQYGEPCRSALVFASRVKESKRIQKVWNDVIKWYSASDEEPSDGQTELLELSVNHLDAKTPAFERDAQLDRLRQVHKDTAGNVCELLTNVRVLTEGVDVPSLDAVVFLQTRRSPIDVTQAVGRVMRRAPHKKIGYVIIPVVLQLQMSWDWGDVKAAAEKTLRKSAFEPVYEIIRALRSHDERLNYEIEAGALPVTFKLLPPLKRDDSVRDDLKDTIYADPEKFRQAIAEKFGSLVIEECGDRHMYLQWGKHAAEISDKIETKINAHVDNNSAVEEHFNGFLVDLQKAVSPNINRTMAVSMLAHHIVTLPVFDEFFSQSHFADDNPVSAAIQKVLDAFEVEGMEYRAELEPLERPYQMMRTALHADELVDEDQRCERNLEKIQDRDAKKLDILRQIYESFFRQAIPGQVKSMGIAYTPVEIVDFVLHSIEAICQKEFGKSISDKNVRILEPFAGTGTFLARLLNLRDNDGNYLIREPDLSRKYRREFFGNELLLLPYYIANLNIEATKHQRQVEEAGVADPSKLSYEPFESLSLVDTLLLDPGSSSARLNLDSDDLEDNYKRVRRQGDADIEVLVTNPPWSSGKDDASEKASNILYQDIAKRVHQTYVQEHTQLTGRAPGGNAGGNLYVKALRWGSDRILKQGQEGVTSGPRILAMVTPNSLSDATSLAGMRKVLRDEFTDIYVANLRGNAYKSGSEWELEGDKVFGSASRNGVQITFLVYDPKKDIKKPATLRIAMVPDSRSLEQKFKWLEDLGDVYHEQFETIPVTPDHAWINLGNPEFNSLMPLCQKNTRAKLTNASASVATSSVAGIKTNLDTYVYSWSREECANKAQALINTYNKTLDILQKPDNQQALDELTSTQNIKSIKWTDALKKTLRKQIRLTFDEANIREVLYRPFVKIWLYEDWRILSAGKTAAALFPRGNETGGGGQSMSQTALKSDGDCLPQGQPPIWDSQGDKAASAPESDSDYNANFADGVRDSRDQHGTGSAYSRSDSSGDAEKATPVNDDIQGISYRYRGGGGSSGAPRATKQFSGPLQPGQQSTCARGAPNKHVESSPNESSHRDPIAIQSNSLRNHSNQNSNRSARSGRGYSPHHAPALLIGSGNGMVFAVCATRTVPDLATIKGSQQTRVVTYRRF